MASHVSLRPVAVLIAVLLAAVLVPGPGVSAQESALPDVCPVGLEPAPFVDRADISPVHRGSVDCAYALGITTGSPTADGLAFLPRHPVRRDALAAFLVRTLEAGGHVLPDPGADPPFTDLEGNIHAEDIAILAAMGVAHGTTDGRFRPRVNVRRDQLASFVVRTVEWAEDESLPPAPRAPFTDVTSANVHSDAIDVAYARGLVRGRTATSYQPAAATRRDQMASVLINLLGEVALPGPPGEPEPTATGTGGAAATVDVHATHTAIEVLRQGGNAVDAAVAAAAVLGVTQPYSSGIGGGGFMLVYLAEQERVVAIDSRETAPQAYHPRIFLDPDTGEPIPFAERVTSGLGVGVPGTVLGWQEALRRYGTMSMRSVLRPAIAIARRGFPVTETYAAQTEQNLERFQAFTSTTEVFLTDDGDVPEVGSIVRNPDLADTYRDLAREGATTFYHGQIAAEIVETVTDPPLAEDATLPVRPGVMTRADVADYGVPIRRPTQVSYRGHDVYGMGPPSSGGPTVGEALNILANFDLAAMEREEALHHYVEASKLAFADRNAYIGDPAYVDVPLAGLLSESFAAERAELIGPQAAEAPVDQGDPYPHQDDPSFPLRPPGAPGIPGAPGATTHLTVSDADRNVVSYTFTIEQIGGSGITVPGRGFLLNNELTDFNPEPPHPNAPEPGKRPRSSMAPTIVLRDGQPALAVGSPGGATIITTVLQILVNQLALDHSLPDAIADPRLANLNTAETVAEEAFLQTPLAAALEQRGHAFDSVEEIGAATGIAFLPDGRVQAAAEPVRRGSGSAQVQGP